MDSSSPASSAPTAAVATAASSTTEAGQSKLLLPDFLNRSPPLQAMRATLPGGTEGSGLAHLQPLRGAASRLKALESKLPESRRNSVTLPALSSNTNSTAQSSNLSVKTDAKVRLFVREYYHHTSAEEVSTQTSPSPAALVLPPPAAAAAAPTPTPAQLPTPDKAVSIPRNKVAPEPMPVIEPTAAVAISPSPVAPIASASSPSPMASNIPPSGYVEIEMDGSNSIRDCIEAYRVKVNKYYLHNPFVFLTPPLVVTDTSKKADQPLSAAANLRSGMDREPVSTILPRAQGKRVPVLSSEMDCSLDEIGCASGSLLTIRTQPFCLRVEIDNSALLKAGVKPERLDKQSMILWVEDRMNIAQLKDEISGQMRENKQILGCERHRLFYPSAPEAPSSSSSVSLESKSDSTSKRLIEITMQLSNTISTLPLRSYTTRGVSSHECTLVVAKDPTRWLHEAILCEDVATAENLILLGADAHLLDAKGNSAFFYAAPRPACRQLLQRYFPPSKLERKAVQEFQASYAGWLHSGACAWLNTNSYDTRLGNQHEERYVFVRKGQTPRLLTNERHKPIGEMDIEGGVGKVDTATQETAKITPTQSATGMAIEAPDTSVQLKSDLRGPYADLLYPDFDETPAFLLFDLELDLSETIKPKMVMLRNPPFRSANETLPEINELKSVSKFRSIITRFDVFKNRYMMNLKMTMLVVSAISAAYSFSFITADKQQWGKNELTAQFALTVVKAIVAVLFFVRMGMWLGWRTILSFLQIKDNLVAKGNEKRLMESYFYFLILEAADVGMILANIRIIGAISASPDPDVHSLSIDNLKPGAPKLSEAQSMSLSIYLSVASLIALNVLDTVISFLADETRSIRRKIHRYFNLHFMVLIQCFASLRLSFDLRVMQVEAGEPIDAGGVLSYITPTTAAFFISYIFGMSVKSLNSQFHPSATHLVMDENLNAKAIGCDSRASIVYVVLCFIVYGEFQHPQGPYAPLLEARRGLSLMEWALSAYFASGIVLLVMAVIPFLFKIMDPDERRKMNFLPELINSAVQGTTSAVETSTKNFAPAVDRVFNQPVKSADEEKKDNEAITGTVAVAAVAVGTAAVATGKAASSIVSCIKGLFCCKS